MSNIKELINKGVPIATPVPILSSELIRNSNNEEETRNIIRKKFDSYLRGLFEYGYDDFDVMMTLTIQSDYDTLEKKLYFSDYGFFSSLLFNLNVDNICRGKYDKIYQRVDFDSYEEAIEKMQGQVIKLKSIRNERQLQKKFPILYEKYLSVKEQINTSRTILRKYLSYGTSERKKMAMLLLTEYGISIHDLLEHKEKIEHFNLETFCNEKATSFEKVLNNFDKIIDYSQSMSINMDEIDIDKDKLELLMVNSFLRMIKTVIPEERQRYIYYIQNYFDTNPEKKTSSTPEIVTNIGNKTILNLDQSNERRITPSDTYREYQEVLINNPNIELVCVNSINFDDMNLEEVEEFVAEYLKNFSANWELIPEGQNEEEIIMDGLAQETKGLSDEEKKRLLQRRIDLFMEKKNFYASQDPFYRIMGKDTFKGYVGFIYPNGKVVLDKFYKGVNSKQVSDGDAIYIMDIEDFYRLSHFEKRVLMKDSRVKRIVHQGNWKERVLQEINGESSRKTGEATDELIKKHHVRVKK